MDKYKMCSTPDMAIDILDFIKRNYEKHSSDAGVQKYIDALDMAIDALREKQCSETVDIGNVTCDHQWDYLGEYSGGRSYRCKICGIRKSANILQM